MNDTAAVREKLSADFHQVMDDIDALMKATTNQAEGEAKALRSRIRERLDAARDQIGHAGEEVLERGKRAVKSTDEYVHTHPWQAVGAAAAVGLALGVLIGRR
ncbi:MAG: DUF883 domain-containing protein [Piscinibacter sp.]|uniref:DUF883 family protein n=1 Tax=Piscinibacter TaxID=1114981 RepID=UPI000FDD8F97|nr:MULTISPECIES: DUF883 family protein [Piscinibacter]MCW5665609.1 DUF883 domain-containing protein [Piscinibacter sp.]